MIFGRGRRRAALTNLRGRFDTEQEMVILYMLLGATGVVITVTVGTAACGNGLMELQEQCDDANAVSGDGCSGTCTAEVTGTVTGPQAINAPPDVFNGALGFGEVDFYQVDMTAPGVSCIVILLSIGTPDLDDVFFDVVQIDGSRLVVPLDRGWDVALYLLSC